ncbi:COP9 signalosome subunit 7 [Drechmeria coniospora]|uniref:COP9 signalosome subunit 7 n=1 Tax=Drechmeria coniospora TaxID=98403 RepID=A0A151GBW5_DRECN|nr:COP9 signalosome subunit 7 [Drechmeria coniospora]KYK54602.1 COP9 signalosome subunit 7 [Drechmeria coniospora]ODA76174.1 hypothetical protein RJ55_08457 [Drechmeria coniospora]
MVVVETKALNALEPFLLLSRSITSPRAAADLVTRATSAPNTYIFAELLQTPQVQALKNSEEYASHLSLLSIFSHGTYQTYHATPNLPPLNDAQTLKLRQLSLLTLARDRSNLSYAVLQGALGLSHARQLEDLVIKAVYEGLLHATLDPARQAIEVTSISPLRDLQPGSVPAMTMVLNSWSDRCISTIGDIEARINAIRANAAARAKEERAAGDDVNDSAGDPQESDKADVPGDEGLPKRGLNKRSMLEVGNLAAGETMELDEQLRADESAKRASKRKM